MIKNDAPLRVCTLAVTAFNIHEANAMNQPNMTTAQSLLSSASSLPSTENNAEQFPAENEQNVSGSIANSSNEVPATNISIGESSLRRKRRSTRPSTENNAEQFPAKLAVRIRVLI
ncbi:unnamed protein product [Coffea canephora]|uniref:Uncharacterized protein n=1 Tax=Coffea canephora TaxID=49390 RepID=A0A068U8U2_COFCA|nr:unnamed protein product [Coffea canephora]